MYAGIASDSIVYTIQVAMAQSYIWYILVVALAVIASLGPRLCFLVWLGTSYYNWYCADVYAGS